MPSLSEHYLYRVIWCVEFLCRWTYSVRKCIRDSRRAPFVSRDTMCSRYTRDCHTRYLQNKISSCSRWRLKRTTYYFLQRDPLLTFLCEFRMRNAPLAFVGTTVCRSHADDRPTRKESHEMHERCTKSVSRIVIFISVYPDFIFYTSPCFRPRQLCEAKSVSTPYCLVFFCKYPRLRETDAELSIPKRHSTDKHSARTQSRDL